MWAIARNQAHFVLLTRNHLSMFKHVTIVLEVWSGVWVTK